MPKLFNIGTNKNGLIVFGGEASADYGIVVSSAPTFEKPRRKQTVYTIPGRNGAIIQQQDAWDDVTRKYKVYALPKFSDLPDAVEAFTGWLNSQTGYTRLEDSFEPDYYRLAYYSGGDSVANDMMQAGETTLQFTCRPERFLKSGEDPIEVVNGTYLNNPTRFVSKPLIHIEVSSPSTVQVSTGYGQAMTAAVTDYLNIDCETMNAYRLPTENKNSEISGKFMRLEPGRNGIWITGSPDLVTITPRWFTI